MPVQLPTPLAGELDALQLRARIVVDESGSIASLDPNCYMIAAVLFTSADAMGACTDIADRGSPSMRSPCWPTSFVPPNPTALDAARWFGCVEAAGRSLS